MLRSATRAGNLSSQMQFSKKLTYHYHSAMTENRSYYHDRSNCLPSFPNNISSPRGFSTSSFNFVKDNTKGKYVPPPAQSYGQPPPAKISFTEEFSRTFDQYQTKLLGKSAERMGVKGLLKEYGLPFAVYYSSLYFGGMGIFYLVLEGGLVAETSVVDWLKMTPVADYVDLTRINPKLGNLAGAIAINEIAEIIRLPFALFTIRYVKKAWDNRKSTPIPKEPKS